MLVIEFHQLLLSNFCFFLSIYFIKEVYCTSVTEQFDEQSEKFVCIYGNEETKSNRKKAKKRNAT